MPRFFRDPAEKTVDLELDLDNETWEELESEALRQRVTIERLVEHAALYLMADLDSGRVATRIPADEDSPAHDHER